MSSSQIIGFTLLRNAIKYDYPFRESLQSLLGLCEQVYCACGESEDGTEKALEEFQNLICLPTKWDEGKRKGGLILSEQTNIALSHVRNNVKKGWAFYLQADEVLLESEYELIKKDLDFAEANGFDAISFRYIHFWLSANQMAIGKRWYPEEIRAIRIDSHILSAGDAQSFQGAQKIYLSEAHIFHYGHVRDSSAYEKKKSDFHRWWHSDDQLKSVLTKSQRKDLKEKTLNYFGEHPQVMQKRIERLGGVFQKKEVDEISIYCEPSFLTSHKNFLNGIRAQKMNYIHSWKDLYSISSDSVVLFKKLTLIQRILLFNRYSSKVPSSSFSPKARKWSKNFEFMLRLSEKEVGYGK